MQDTGFSPEEICRCAQQNATATMLAGFAYVQEQGLSGEDYAHWIGRRFAPGWERVREEGALAVARQAALSIASVGGVLLSISGDEARAEVTVGAWPAQEVLTLLDLSQTGADAAYHIFRPIAESLGLQYEWQRGADQVRLAFSR